MSEASHAEVRQEPACGKPAGGVDPGIEDAWTRRWLSIVLGPLPLVGRLGFLGEGAVQDLENQERGRREDEQKEGQRSGGVVGQDVDEDDDTSD